MPTPTAKASEILFRARFMCVDPCLTAGWLEASLNVQLCF
ncbi:hypothetical protein APY04_3425 [Hyphomicrobium sulfonivorans]|uniref:Uncharacterized protein n=1 Tax=Hyphomicrobium sulfonivorans TaxID=121290 RepID=A0A109B8J3_HYPSL|nr:hypothetical protein APY04_3425 [Hyphomicrobium sulfonivorans]